MVDIKRNDITLSDWTKGISVDEFAGGSYYYAEGIQSGYSTKGFKLGHRLTNNVLNYREDGYAVAVSPIDTYDMIAFTADGRIEAQTFWNGSTEQSGDTNGGGAVINVNRTWVNGIVYRGQAIGIGKSSIDLIAVRNLYQGNGEMLENPRFENGGTGWTIGNGWTIGSTGAVHTTGNTGYLRATFTPSSDSMRIRTAVKVVNRNNGYITVSVQTSAGTRTDTINCNGWFVLETTAGSNSSSTITITPTSSFDGTIEAVNINPFVNFTTNVQLGKSSITTSDTHPCVIWGGELYIGSGNKVDIVSLSDWTVITKGIIDESETIVDITQQAGNLIIWATDGNNSKQYYWNGVDGIATECIEWKGLIIKGVVGTETLSYVLTTAGATSGNIEGYQYRLYAVSGYQRNLLANKIWFPNSAINIDKQEYHSQKKFDFNDVSSSKSMCIFLDSLFLPGCDGLYKYGTEIPGIGSIWTKPIVYPNGSTNVILGQKGVFLDVLYTHNKTNYISQVTETRFTNKGYLVTEGIYRDKLSSRKSIEKLRIGYKNVSSEDGNIKIYTIVDDDYFWRFFVSGLGDDERPEVGAEYMVANQTKGKVYDVDKINGIISLYTTENLGSYPGQSIPTISKISGIGKDEITYSGYDNMSLVKTITNSHQGYGSDLIFGKDFVNNQIPYWHKMQIVIELNTIDSRLSPEIFEISMVSDITDNNL